MTWSCQDRAATCIILCVNRHDSPGEKDVKYARSAQISYTMYILQAVANESGINFISVKGPELLNMVSYLIQFGV